MEYCRNKQRWKQLLTSPSYEPEEANDQRETTEDQKTTITKSTKTPTRTMMKINTETNCTQVLKTREEKNKNTITREDKVAESIITHKSNSDITTKQAKGKKTIATEPGTKSEKGRINTGKSPRELKQTGIWNPG